MNDTNKNNHIKKPSIILILCIIVAAISISVIFLLSHFSGNETKGKYDLNTSYKKELDYATSGSTNNQTIYTAEDLSNKSLNEIINLMGEEFTVEYNGEHLIYYTSGGLCIYNNETLPGFVFFIKPANGVEYGSISDPNTDLSGVKEDILAKDKYVLDFIALFDSAKLNNSISADMNYKDFISAYGEVETVLLPGSGSPGHYIDNYNSKYIDDVIVYYESFDEAYSSSDTVSKHIMTGKNPSITGIVVLPVTTIDQGNQSSQTKSDNWKQTYIDYLSTMDTIANSRGIFVNINDDDIPEIIMPGDFEMAATKLLWIDSSGVVYEDILGARTINVSILKPENKILHSDFQIGHAGISVYQLTDKELKKIYSASYSGNYNFAEVKENYRNNESQEIDSYYIDQRSVSQKEFWDSLISVFDFTSSDCTESLFGDEDTFSVSEAQNAILNYN